MNRPDCRTLFTFLAFAAAAPAATQTATVLYTATPNPALLGQAVTLGVFVTPGTASGTVTFFDGSTPLGAAPLTGGQAFLVTHALPFGNRSLRARYGGDASNLSSFSAPVIQVVSVPAEASLNPLVAQGAQGDYPNAVALADLNGDGIQDLVIANLASDSVSVFLGQGDGTFSYTCTRASGTTNGSEPSAVVVADFNADGYPDLAVANEGESTVSILLGNGDGTFQETAGTYVVSADPLVELYGPNPASIVAADFNGDGFIDVATANFGDSSVSVLLGNGDGTLRSAFQYTVGSTPNGLAAADFNADGIADLAVADADPGFDAVYVLLGTGAGAFSAPVSYPGGLGPTEVIVGDFNNDGKPDLAIADAGDYVNPSTGGVTILLGDGKGGFHAAPNPGSGPALVFPNGIAGGDLNGDGNLDVVVTDQALGLTVLYGAGDGTFQSTAAFPSGSIDTPPSSFAVALADLNGDALTDVAVVNSSPDDDNYGILLGLPGTCAFTLSASASAFDASGGSFALALGSNSPGCSWSFVSTPFLLPTPFSGIGGGSIPVSVQPNSTGIARTGSITLGAPAVSISQWGTVQAFTDVPVTAYYFDGVDLLKQKAITSGCGATTYCPSESITRAQMAIFLVRAVYGGDDFTSSPTPYFEDVPASAFGFAWIQKLFELGITSGCGPSLYCPNNFVTRDQMAVFIIRARFGSQVVFDSPAVPYFTDVPAQYWAFPWIQRLKLDAITGGCGATTFCPGNAVTRGDMAMFVMRGAFNQLLPAGTPVISSVTPNILPAGQTVTVTVTGVNTAFLDGQTVMNPIPGITIGPVAVSSATTLSVQITASAPASPQPISLFVITGAQEAILPNGLTIE